MNKVGEPSDLERLVVQSLEVGAAERHQNQIKFWPWYGCLVHWVLSSWRYPACIYWKEHMRG